MIEKSLFGRTALLIVSGAALVSASPPDVAPGRGVLCLGTFIYFVEKTGSQCHRGEDADFQARIASYAQRFDEYIIRNTGGDPSVLAKFKERQNLTSQDPAHICEGDIARSYDHFKASPANELDAAVDELLAQDGPPSFGDCV